ncbi:arylsulfatase [Echinicola marina]|uniref:arylsulfatase n=1 Tax=Echinicola marina TaxID=2859768 RepID=UPI001CF65E4F|nr:arylsulfatase [Echinicola marina]UCS94029.1 arylsulfatase [Echinicola marina]
MKNINKTLIAKLFVGMSILSSCNPKETVKQPNVMIILADDMGFSDIGSYGGEVKTPNLDKLAKGGIRYTQFYNNARCCPTRASLMTGLYPHQAGMGWMTAADLGTPQYQGELNQQCVTIAEVLHQTGYKTYMSGKWHLSRVRNIQGEVKDNWPIQRGFDEFFGIVDGASNYFIPNVYSDNEKYPIKEEGFYFTHAVSDSTVNFIDQHFKENKEDPFFMYLAYTAPHWPLHALEKDIEKYKTIYMAGWDSLRAERLVRQKTLGIFDGEVELSSRNEKVPAWNSLSQEEKEAFAMRMAIYAAQIDAMDQGIGRVIKKLEDEGQLDNTIIFFLSDNGACAEFISNGKSKELNGQADTWESYRINWANMSSTPYKEFKHWIHEGGIATPMIVHWPNGIDKDLEDSFVREPGHLTDLMATIVDITGAQYPEAFKGNKIIPMQGQSIADQFEGNPIQRKAIFWEHEANIGVREGKWKLVAKTAENADFDPSTLELYNMEEDPAELNDLSKDYAEKKMALYEKWKDWAAEVQVYPLDTRDYGKRSRDYQKQINGQFQSGFGGWQRSNNKGIRYELIKEESNNKASITFSKEVKEATEILAWPFWADKGEVFNVAMVLEGEKGKEFNLMVETVGKKPVVVAQSKVKLTDSQLKYQVNEVIIPKNDRYQLSLYSVSADQGDHIIVHQASLQSKD